MQLHYDDDLSENIISFGLCKKAKVLHLSYYHHIMFLFFLFNCELIVMIST